jgi:3-hydroxy acid dehydrogenase / malonic semialdehyde reductase
MKNVVVITGASSGIGRSCALVFAQAGYNLILTARRIGLLRSQVSDIIDQYGVSCLPLELDVRNKNQVNAVLGNLPAEWKDISVLINNAGLALGLNTIEDGDSEDWDTMIDTNVKGLLYVSQAIMSLMVARKSGHIINIGSIAGREVYPRGNVYCATKHAVDALTKAMRIDLLQYGIKVTQVSPGAVETEFSVVRFKGNAEKAKSVYDGYVPLNPQDVAEVVLFCASRPAHVNINDVLVMPTAQACAGIFNKNLQE